MTNLINERQEFIINNLVTSCYMASAVSSLSEGHIAEHARKWAFPRVASQVQLHTIASLKSLKHTF